MAGGPDSSTNAYATSRVDATPETSEGTTVFVEDATVPTAEIMHPISIMRSLQSSASYGSVTDIHAWLGRPTLIVQGTLTASDGVGSFGQFPALSQILSASTMSSKVSGIFGLRATAVYKLQVNGNKFMQGRYMLSFLPVGGSPLGGSNAVFWSKMHNFTLSQRSQLPHVELDLSCDTSCVLRVPYVSMTDYYPLSTTNTSSTKFGDPGFVQIFPYVALSAPTGGATPSYTLWAWLEDVELVGAVYPQSRVKFSKPPTEAEQSSAGVGPISGVLSKVANAARIVGEIPLLSSVALPASWASEILSRAAMALGWSAPLNLMATNRIQHTTFPYMGSVDAVDNSLPLSLSVKNSVEAAPGFAGTDIDELAFSSFLTRPTWMTTVSWTTATAAGASLYTSSLSPTLFTTSATDATSSYVNHSPMSLMASRFSLWRGGFVFTIKIVKTPFHSGRLTFWFNPGENIVATASTPTTDDERFYVQRQILDIREANQFTVTIPYASLLPYRSTVTATSGYMGVMGISVLDMLNNPSSVSNTVSIIVEVSTTPDFEFAVPRNSSYCPVTNTVPQGNVCFSSCSPCFSDLFSGDISCSENSRVSPQSNIDFKPESNVCNLVSTMVGTSSFSSSDHSSARICIGEKILSLRSLLKCSSIMSWSSATLDNTKFRTILPFAIPMTVSAAVPSTSTANLLPDLYGILGSIFAFSRGGVRYKIVGNTLQDVVYTAYSNEVPYGTGAYTQPITFGATDSLGFATTNSQRGVPQIIAAADQTRGLEIQVPQYHFMHSRANSDHMVGGGVNYAFTYGGSRMALNVQTVPTPTTGSVLYRSGADDCSFGCFVSIPPMYSINAV